MAVGISPVSCSDRLIVGICCRLYLILDLLLRRFVLAALLGASGSLRAFLVLCLNLLLELIESFV